jgi:hypothetical protein
MTLAEKNDVLDQLENRIEFLEYKPGATRVDLDNLKQLQRIHYQLCKQWEIKRGINT